MGDRNYEQQKEAYRKSQNRRLGEYKDYEEKLLRNDPFRG